jgi:hypothetical protein
MLCCCIFLVPHALKTDLSSSSYCDQYRDRDHDGMVGEVG